jgi:hypothetical protein
MDNAHPPSGSRETDEKTEVQPSLVPTEQDIAAEREQRP